MTAVCFVDCETTSLRPDRRAWEVGLILRRPGEPEQERSWFIAAEDLDLGNADPASLKIGRFYERHPAARGLGGTNTFTESSVMTFVEQITRNAVIVGAVPNFDTEVLAARMRANGTCPSWRYHLVDVETLAAGALKLPPPWDFDAVLGEFGLAYDEADRHTALGLIANAGEGDWNTQTAAWREAAERWRDRYHARLATGVDTDGALEPLAAPAVTVRVFPADDGPSVQVDWWDKPLEEEIVRVTQRLHANVRAAGPWLGNAETPEPAVHVRESDA